MSDLAPYTSFGTTSILVVAEKPKIAKSIKNVLETLFKSSATYTKGQAKYNPIYELSLQHGSITITSVNGFLYSHDFPSPYAKGDTWSKVDPIILTTITPTHIVSGKGSFLTSTKNVIAQLKKLAKTHDLVVIATDNDYAGERIGYQIWDTIRTTNKNIPAMRMIFPSTTLSDIKKAWLNPRPMRFEHKEAELARALSDLLMGSIFTRQFTLAIQRGSKKRQMLTYGMCQSLVLKHVVDTWRSHYEFIPKPYWFIQATVSDGKKKFVVKWDRGNEFDVNKATVAFNSIKNVNVANVDKVTKRTRPKHQPTPLRTVTLQSSGSFLFKMSPKQVMDIAEDLYLSGFTSYPRTESDTFSSSFDTGNILGKFLQHPDYGGYTGALLRKTPHPVPRTGTHRTQDHDPIHPVQMGTKVTIPKAVKPQNSARAYAIYDYIARRFIASCSPPAKIDETSVSLDIGMEKFTLMGDIIKERGYLDIFPFDKMSEKIIPPLKKGDQLTVDKIELMKDQTKPPPLVTYSQIIKDLDKMKIGTDATLHTHVQTVQDRGYVKKDTNYLIPTNIGIALIESLEEYAPQLIDMKLRAKLESLMTMIADGKGTRKSVYNAFKKMAVDSYRELRKNEKEFVDKVAPTLPTAPPTTKGSGKTTTELGSCPKCGKNLFLHVKTWSGNQHRSATCESCNASHPLPKKGAFNVLKATCPKCKKGNVIHVNNKYYVCPVCFTMAIPEGTLPCFKCTDNGCKYSSVNQQKTPRKKTSKK